MKKTDLRVIPGGDAQTRGAVTTDGTGDETTPLAQFFDDLAAKPGGLDARIMAVLFTVIFALLTVTLGISAFQAIWDHQLWVGIVESIMTVGLSLITVVVAVVGALEFTSLAKDLDR